MARTNVRIPYVFEFQSYVTGHHVYKDIWAPTLDEKLTTAMEPENHHNKYVVKVLKRTKWLDMFPVIFQSIITSHFCVGDYKM